MAQWKETLEPYVKVTESVKSTPLNPTAGEDLIIGAVIISDAGPSQPTLITSQKEFLKTYAAEDLTQKYTDSLDALYSGENKSLASTMWLNAYRLAGSGNLLISRATKADGLVYAKTFDKNDSHDYIVKDSEILRSCNPFKFVIDLGVAVQNEGGNVSRAASAGNGWAISIKDIGVIGNRVNNNGPLYDYYVDNLYDLVQKLNETNKFYSPDYEFYTDAECENKVEVTEDNKTTCGAVAVKFNTVFLAGGGIMETNVVDAAGNIEEWGTDSKGVRNTWGEADTHSGKADVDSNGIGYAYIIPETIDGKSSIDLNGEEYSGFESPEYYAENIYNSRTNLEVRIRRYNHNAVQSTGSSYIVLQDVLNVYTGNGTKTPADNILAYDFYEFQITDPSISDAPVVFNVGNISGRGDISVDELNESLGLIHLNLPQDLGELGMNYYGYADDNITYSWDVYEPQSGDTVETGNKLPKASNELLGKIYKIGEKYYKCSPKSTDEEEIKVELKIGTGNTQSLLMVSNSDIMKAWDRIEEDERYIVEGMTDLGCTETDIQNYMANIAVNSNYFYAVSTCNSTNYMVIASKKQRIIQDSRKLWFGAPWDLDSGSVGYLFGCSPSVLYWETVLRNRRNNQEFAAAFGQNRGIASVVKLAKEFKKSERQLLLTKKINTIFKDVYLGDIT
ncbi:MAG: hypothetical protein K2N48_04625, partial [Muribaculaceae bacterium]|nr:hypothetical protein [Muribaculaceae bacterium]